MMNSKVAGLGHKYEWKMQFNLKGVLLWVALAILAGPFLPFYSMGDSGITLFDFGSIIVFFLFFKKIPLLLKSQYIKVTKAIFILYSAYIFSLSWHAIHFENLDLTFIYSLRFFEYSLWSVCGLMLSNSRFYKYILIYISTASLFIFFPNILGLNHGVFVNDFEIGAVGGLLGIYFLEKQLNYWKLFLIVGFLMALISGERTQFFAFIFSGLGYWFFAKSKISMFRLFTFRICPAVLCVSLFLILFSEGRPEIVEQIYGRTAQVFQSGNIDAIKIVMDKARESADYNQFVYEDRSLLSDAGDLSFQLRLRKWGSAALAQSEHILSIFFGLGPGYFGGAADGSYLRVYFELGLIGILALLIFIRRLWTELPQIKYTLTCFLLNGLFIDTIYSAKVFTIFILIVYFELKNKTNEHNKLLKSG